MLCCPWSAPRRPALSRTFAAFGAQWRQQPTFTASLLASLTADVQGFADKAAAAAPGAGAGSGAGSGAADGAADAGAAGSLRQLLALAACVLPMVDALVAARQPVCQQHLLQLLAAFRQAAAAAAAPAAVIELAGHVGRLAALAPAASAAAFAAVGLQNHVSSEEQQQATADHVAVELIAASMQALSVQEQQPAATADVEHVLVKFRISKQPAAAAEAQLVGGLQQQFAAVAAFAEGAASRTEVLAQPAAVLALLAAVRCWLQMLGQQPAEAAAGAGGVLLATAGQSVSQGSESSSSSWLLKLRSYSSKEVVLQAAQLVLLVLQRSPAAVLAALLADTELQAASLLSTGQQLLQSGADAAPALLLVNLQLLQTAVPQLPAAGLWEAWQRLLPLARPGVQLAAAGDQQASQLWQLLLRTLQTAAQRLALRRQQGPADGAAVGGQALALLAAILAGQSTGSDSTPEPVLLLALQWLQQTAEWPAPQAPAAGGDGFAAALAAALACADAPSAQLRAAALAALRALVRGSKGSSLLLQDAALAAELFQTAASHLSDLHPAVAAAAQELVLAAAVPLALSSTLAAAGSSSSNDSSPAASDAVAAALQAQRLGFRPALLQQWLDHLTGTSGPTTVLTAAGQHQAAPLRQWLPRLLASMQAVPGSSNPGALPW